MDVRIEDLEGCPRYIGRLFRDVEIGPSPAWLRARLTAAGMRPISNVVDVTNYVMLALGNPLHAFDFSTLAEGRVVVRRARPGEEIRTLDGDGAQARSDRPPDRRRGARDRAGRDHGRRGDRGTDATTSVLLEAANFEPVGIWRSSERMRLRTEGSNRWEKGVDPYLAEQAAGLATELHRRARGRTLDRAHRRAGRAARAGRSSRYRPEKADAVIGHRDARRRSRKRRSTGSAASSRAQRLSRPDLARPRPDARDRRRRGGRPLRPCRRALHAAAPARDDRPAHAASSGCAAGSRTSSSALGFNEAYTPSLRPDDADPDAIALEEPISIELAVLRTELLPSLVDFARRNADAGNRNVALFEIAHVYLPRRASSPTSRCTWPGSSKEGSRR